MLRNKIYYWIKPVIPRRLRMTLRGWLVNRQRRHVNGIWPILPGSERPPMNWPGWPGGKKFAVVLTHDVEGPGGVANCLQLMRLERELGFVSSFNFVPEGTYRTPPDLRSELVQNGFEVGVHDFNHDGHLYDSRSGFQRKAAGINRYLEEWNAVGFRSGFMLNRLDWIHDLKIQYDASTFDTDPFEPQPEGRNTIFPFWVARNGSSGGSNSGYVELPYTLPQDSTLFFHFREKTNDIWKRKLDWVAEHGGMALINVHPDYMCFNPGEEKTYVSYPASLYSSFLEYIATRYRGTYWNALPREVGPAVVLPFQEHRNFDCAGTHSNLPATQ